MRSTFNAEQRRELLALGLYREQVQRLEVHALQSISWRRTRAPRMQDVRDRLTGLATALRRVEKLYVRMSTSKVGASQEANARLQSAADDLLADPDKLGDSLETATNIVNRALEWLSPTRRSTRRNTAYFVQLIVHALQLGHSDHFDCTGYGDTPLKEPMPPSPVAFVKQANIAHGPQQVNNALPPPPRARGTPKISQTNYWSTNAMNGWTPERRKRQSELIRRWRPWEKSTGPRTTRGKKRVARNAYKGGTRLVLRSLARMLRRL
jgi:hypothetical protein